MKSKRSRTYLVSGLTLALIFVAIILVFRDVLPDIVKDLSTVPFWGVLLLLALGFAYEAMESVLCLVIIHHKKPDCTFIDALRVTFLGVFGNITTLGAGTLPMQSFYLYRRGLDAGSGLGIMASEYVLHKISVLIYATVALLLGGDWLEQSASGLARYLLIGYVIGALIVIALTLLYTWDKVLKLVLMLLGKLPHTPKWDERREKWANSLTELNREAKKVLLVPSIRVKGIAVSLAKLFVLYSIPYAALRLVGCTALNFAQATAARLADAAHHKRAAERRGRGPDGVCVFAALRPVGGHGNRLVGAGTLSRGDVFLPVPSERDRVSPRGEEIFERL